MIRIDREMQEIMPTQDGFYEQIDSVTHNGERDAFFCAASIERNDPLINREIVRKSDERVPIGLDQFDLARETDLAGDLAVHPSLFPVTPGWQGESLQHRVGGVDPGDGPIEITKHLSPRGLPAQT